MTKLMNTVADERTIEKAVQDILGKNSNFFTITVDEELQTTAWIASPTEREGMLLELLPTFDVPKLKTEEAIKKEPAHRKIMGLLRDYATDENKKKSPIINVEEKLWKERKITTKAGAYVAYPIATGDKMLFIIVANQKEAKLLFDQLN
jgi:hypothetical protein